LSRSKQRGNKLQNAVKRDVAALERWGKGDPDGFLEIYADEITYFDLTQERRVDGRPQQNIRSASSNHQSGSDCGSPNQGSTLLSKRVMAPIRSPVRVRTKRPVPWRMPPVGARR